MALFEPAEDTISAHTLVVGGGIAGMTTAIETAEIGKDAIIVEREPSLGGRVARIFQYFPKMCPPTCGIEINLKRIRANFNIRVLTLAEIESVSGAPGNFDVKIRLNPRFVNNKCTGGEVVDDCPVERDNDFNYGLDKTKAVYIPHLMAYPFQYVVDPRYVGDPALRKWVQEKGHDWIDLDQKPRTITAKVGAIVWATGWKPYDATRIDNLGFGQYPNVITNVIMERLASENGPTQGKILRPSDQGEVKTVGFVQCAGSRDEKHLPYCSAICCMASMKQATYVREKYPEADVHIFYIDVRSPGRWEDFYMVRQDDPKIHFHRGKVARITENPANNSVILEAENTLTGQITKTEVDLAVLATGMVPNNVDFAPPLNTPLDDFGFIAPNPKTGVFGAGVACRPVDVSASVQEATGVALKAVIKAGRR